MKTCIKRYERAASIWFEDADGKRDLVVDIYGPEERREAIIAALLAVGIITKDS